MKVVLHNNLNLLPMDLIEKAQEMSQAYQYIYCLENILRMYLDEHPSRSAIYIPASCQKLITSRKNAESNLKWASARGGSDLYYLDFKDLQIIVIENWKYLQNDFPSLNWIISKVEDLTHCRNLIAHNSHLGNSELELIKVHFNLISRQLGLNKLKTAAPKVSEPVLENLFVEGFASTALWSYEQACKGVSFPLNFPAEVEVVPLALKIFYLQIGVHFQVLFDDAKAPLFPQFTISRRNDMLEEYQLQPDTLIQIGQYDIDKDGIPELFICTKDNKPQELSEGLEIKVYKYFPPALRQHAYRTANWEEIGNFKYQNILGDPKAFLVDNSIKVPRNLRGFFYRHTYSEGKFRDTGEW